MCPISRHQSGIIYLFTEDTEDDGIIKDLKKCLKDRLQPLGYAYYGGVNCFCGGQGMSIPTFDFEECLAKYRWDAIQVILLFFIFYLFTVFHMFFLIVYVFLVLGPISCLQYEGTRASYP